MPNTAILGHDQSGQFIRRVFHHAPLNYEKQQIRLLEVLAEPNGPFQCLVRVYERASCPPYEAVSYVWGSEAATQQIIVNQCWFPVRNNLWQFLHHAANHYILISGSKAYVPKYLWIDQLCIDQQSTLEKNHQVQAMGSIFGQAERVIAWLGPSDFDSGMDYVPFCLDTDSEALMLTKYKTLARPGRGYTVLEQLTDIFQRPYWHRLWVAQEFILGRTLLVACGARALPWADLAQFEAVLQTDANSGDTRVVGDATSHFRLRRERLENDIAKPLSLDSVLIRLSHLNCSDPRDKVFGLLALTSSDVVVDYSRSPEEVFWSALPSLQASSMDSHFLVELAAAMDVVLEDFIDHGSHEVRACELCAFSYNDRIRDLWQGLGLDPHFTTSKYTRLCDRQDCRRCSDFEYPRGFLQVSRLTAGEL
jgi:hypothetical protein